MKIEIKKAEEVSKNILKFFGFSEEESALITRNFIDAELSGKKSHGLISLFTLKEQLDEKKLNIKKNDFNILKETPSSIYINGNYKPGFVVLYKSLDLAIKKAKKSGVVAVALKNLGYSSGYIGSYARLAAENDFIFICFSNPLARLIPYGLKKGLWGTNPLTVGIPSVETPIILDMASSQITWSELLSALRYNQEIKPGTALDAKGRPTVNPKEAIEGGLLPIAGYKGSGLAFIIELLAGALTNSRVGQKIPGGFGIFFIVIDPNIFRAIEDFKATIGAAIQELKEAPKLEGFDEVYYPGERSSALRRLHLANGFLEIREDLWLRLLNFIN